MSAKTRSAGRCGNDGTCLDEDLGKSFPKHLEINLLGSGDHDDTEPVSHLAAVQNIRCDTHILDPAVGTGTDDYLIDLDIALCVNLVNGLCILGKMRKCNGGTKLCKIDLDHLIILCIRICLINGILLIRSMLLHILDGLLIHREDAVLGTGFNGHVCNREPVIHGQCCNTLSRKLHGLVTGAVHTDLSDDVKDQILTADPGGLLSLQNELDRRGNLEPGLTGHHTGCHIRGANTCGERTKRSVGTGVGVSTDAGISCHDQAFLRKECMLDSHLSHIKIVHDIICLGEISHLLHVLRTLDILIRREMIHDQCDLRIVKYCFLFELGKLIDGNRSGNIISKHKIQICLDQVSGVNLRKSGVCSKDLLCHCHTHD